MRVYFCGSHATGKTTLSRYVSKKYNIPMITEIARKVLSEKELDINSLRCDLDLVDSYQSEVIERQIEEESLYDSFVSDRSFDGLAYIAQHSRALHSILKLSKLTEYIESLKAPDVILFFIRPSVALMKADGVREKLNWDGIVQIDAMVKLLIKMFDLRYFQINTDNMQERADLVDAVIGLSMNKKNTQTGL